MKKNYLRWTVMLFAGLSLTISSCNDSDANGDEPSNPIFPEAVETAVMPGDTYTLRFETNMDWEASIPASAAQAFYIQDGTQQTLRTQGKAGNAEVEVGCYDIESFDDNLSCEVTLTMAKQSKVIATLTINNQERSLVLRTSKEEDGGFVYGTEGLRYEYNEEPAESIDLIWPIGNSGYMYPIVVEANFAWRLAEKSEWIADADYVGEAGQQVEILLRADPTKYPLDGDEDGKFVLCARNNAAIKYEYKVTIPACRDHFSVSGFAAESRFNAQGLFFNASSSSWVNSAMHGEIASVEEPVIYKFMEVSEGDNTYWDPEETMTSWIKIETALEDADNVLKTYRYTVTVEENTSSDARKGVILALPASVAATVTTPYELAGNEIEEQYQKYIVTTINQAGNTTGEFVEFFEDLGPEMAQFYSLSKLPQNDFPYEDKWAAVPVIYNLTYTTEMAGEMAELKFNVPYDSYEVYGEEGPYAESQLQPRWVDLADGYNGDNCKRIMIACTYDEQSNSFIWTYEKPVNPEAYFVFKNGDEIVGIIQFKFDEGQQGGNNGEVSLATPINGVTLDLLTSSDSDFDAEMNYCPQYKLTITDASVKQIPLNLPENDESTYYDDEVVYLYPSDGTYTLMLFFEKAGTTEIMLKNQYMIIGRIYVVYQPE